MQNTIAPTGTAPPLPPGFVPRHRLAQRLFAFALFLLPACAIATSWGLAPGAAAALAAVLLGADRLLAVRGNARGGVRPLWLLALLVLAVTVGSMIESRGTWSAVDNYTRVLAMPLFALAVVALRPARAWLWTGTVVGLAGACVVLLVESHGGAARADGWTNAIVAANATVSFIAVAVFCREPGRLAWVLLAVLLGAAAVLLTGSRGAWPAMALLLLFSLAACSWRARRRLSARTWALFACLLAILATLALPLTVQRVRELQTAVAQYERGEHDTSYGARRDLLRVSLDALRTQPLTGVGVGNFQRYLETRAMCRRDDAIVCELDHAHSELPHWGATMGVPGLLAGLLLYAVPLLLFLRGLRGASQPTRSANAAGALLVLCFLLGGLSQSMFAHQLTASLYSVLVGLLIGFGIVEGEIHPAHPSAPAQPVPGT